MSAALLYVGGGYVALAVGCWGLIEASGRTRREAVCEALKAATAISVFLIGVLGFLAAFITWMEGQSAG